MAVSKTIQREKESTMSDITKGQKVKIAIGTRVGLKTGEYHESGPLEGYEKTEWLRWDENAQDVVLTVTDVGSAHATMNGGGRDYTLVDECGERVTVRTSFQNPASSVFLPVLS